MGIDNISPGDSTDVSARGGMRNYLQDLVDNLPAHRPDWTFKLFTPAWSTPFAVEKRKNLQVVTCNVPRKRNGRVVFENFVLPGMIRRQGVDVWLGTCNTLPFRLKCPATLVIQSLQVFTRPEGFSRLRRAYLQLTMPWSIRRANRLIALSQASKDEIVNRFQVAEGKIVIIHHSLQSGLRSQTASAKGPVDPPFILCVSALYPYKNHVRLIEAFAQVLRAFPQYKLAIVGSDTEYLRAADLAEMTRKFGVEHEVLLLGRVGNAELAALYATADVMAMPSLDETFGLTVLEAMHFGSPVLTSNLSSMAEVGGEAALLVDPASVDAIAQGLRTILSDATLRAQMVDRGRKRAALFMMDRMIQKVLATLEGAVRNYAA